MNDRPVAFWRAPHWLVVFGAAAALGLVAACGSDSTDTNGATHSGHGGATTSSVSVTMASSGSGGVGGTASVGGWQTLAPVGKGARQENAVAALDGEVFVVGGFNDRIQVVGDVEAYDPSRDSWRNVTLLPQPRHHINAATVAGKIYALGGLGGTNFAASPASWVYDPVDGFWTPIAPMPAGTERGWWWCGRNRFEDLHRGWVSRGCGDGRIGLRYQ